MSGLRGSSPARGGRRGTVPWNGLFSGTAVWSVWYAARVRYRAILEQFHALVKARDVSAREWKISERVVMCVTFDMFAAAESALQVPAHSERIPTKDRLTRLVRVMYFDVKYLNHARSTTDGMSEAELEAVEQRTRQVDDWVAGKLEALPASTSTIVSDRLRPR